MTNSTISFDQRAKGALWGTACGDAFGMPNSFLKQIPWLTEMIEGPANSPYHAGYKAGRITDDTEQALALTEALLEGFTPDRVAKKLNEWFISVGGQTSLAVGPSTMRAMLAYQAGAPVSELGQKGVTNGSAMRISPIGVYAARKGCSMTELVDLVEVACSPTHNTSPAISGSAAIAAAVMSAMLGRSWEDVVDSAIEGAALGRERGNWIYAPDIDVRIREACRIVRGADTEKQAADLISSVIGTGEPCTESVPASIAFADFAKGNPRQGILIAANSRGDTDTTGAMTGAVCGAFSGQDAIPREWRTIVGATNALDVDAWWAKLDKAAA